MPYRNLSIAYYNKQKNTEKATDKTKNGEHDQKCILVFVFYY